MKKPKNLIRKEVIPKENNIFQLAQAAVGVARMTENQLIPVSIKETLGKRVDTIRKIVLRV